MSKQDQLSKHVKVSVTASFLINVVLNFLVAYFLNREKLYSDMTRMQTLQELFIDLLITGAVIGAANAWFGFDGMKKAKLTDALDYSEEAARLMRKSWLFGLLLGIMVGVLIFLLTLAVFFLFSFDRFTLISYAVYKAVAGGMIGAVVTFRTIGYAAKSHQTKV